MNRKLEDKLVELAFGDVTPGEAQRLEALATGDAEASRVLQTYRDMKGGLKLLADVPPDQMSNDRLRDAILARGLTKTAPAPEPAPSPRGWWLVPVSVCLMAFCIVSWRNGQKQAMEPQIIGMPSALTAQKIELPQPRLVVPKNPVVAASVVVPPVTAVRVAMNERTVTHRFASSLSRRGSRRHLRGSSSSATIVLPSAPIDAAAISAAMSDENTKYTSMPAGSTGQPIVLIAQEKDAGTNTQVATEVESASNVLVGG